LNFKLSNCIGVFGQRIGGVIDCNERETEKRHECTNLGKSKTTQIMMATVRHVTSGSGLEKICGRLTSVGQRLHKKRDSHRYK
jgi:hypothetical protein